MNADSETPMGLVDARQYDELLRTVSWQSIAEAMFRYHRADRRTSEDPDWWAVQFWGDLWAERDWVSRNEDQIREGILALVNAAETDNDFDYLAAAVMEVFAIDDESRLRWIEENAASSERFRRSLRNVWVWELPDRVYDRIERAAGVVLRRPDREEYERRMGRS